MNVLIKNWFFFCVMIIFIACFGVFIYIGTHKIYEKEAVLRHEIATMQLKSAASTVEFFFSDVRSKQNQLLDEPEIKSFMASKDHISSQKSEIKKELNRLISHSENISQAYLIDLEGNVILHADNGDERLNSSHGHLENGIISPKDVAFDARSFFMAIDDQKNPQSPMVIAVAGVFNDRGINRGYLILKIDLPALFRMIPEHVSLDYSEVKAGRSGGQAGFHSQTEKGRTIISRKVSDQETLHYTYVPLNADQSVTVLKHHKHALLSDLFRKLVAHSTLIIVVFICFAGILSFSTVQRFKEKIKANKTMMHALIALTDWRDPETGNHLIRTQRYSALLAKKLREKGNKKQISKQFISDIYDAAPLHDIGKVGIKDSILLKPGKFTPEEFDVMKQHVIIGKLIIRDLIHRVGEDNSVMQMALNICLYHHEKYDGKGYPDGLRGTQIPLEARIFALADVYDALRSERPYKKSMRHDSVVDIIKHERGKHFDPELVDVFMLCHQEFKEISTKKLPMAMNTSQQNSEGTKPITFAQAQKPDRKN